jgi:hypothetical protein
LTVAAVMSAVATQPPSPNDVLLVPRPVLRCGRCRVALADHPVTLGALLGRVGDHIAAEHCGGGQEAGWPAGRAAATPPGAILVPHRADDGAVPRVTEFDLFAGNQGLFCGLSPCRFRLAHLHVTVEQLLSRVDCHARQRHSGRPRSPQELRAAYGMATGLPAIHRRGW